MIYIVVGVGGIFGSVARYYTGSLIAKYYKSIFPWGTFVVNMVGAILLGAVSALNMNNIIYLLLAEGFLGAFTTFSTFMYEGVTLLKSSKYAIAAVYIVVSVTLGVIGFGISYYLAAKLFS